MDGWIKVKSPSPIHGVVVLVAVETEELSVAEIRIAMLEGGEWLETGGTGGEDEPYAMPFNDDETVTHWMPLPELPGKGKVPNKEVGI